MNFCHDSQGGVEEINVRVQIVSKRKHFNSGSHIATTKYNRQLQIYYLPLATFDNIFCYSWRYGFPGYYNHVISELYGRTVNLVDRNSKIKVLYCFTTNIIKFQLCSANTTINEDIINTFLSNRLS